MTEDGNKTIKWIVDNQYTGKVASYNNEGKLVWNKIISHSVEKNYGKQWVSIRVPNQKEIIVTSDHEVAVTKNILFPKIEFIPAAECGSSYIIRKANEINSTTHNENRLFNNEQITCLIGSLLGDGSIDKFGYLKFGHSIDQKEYLQFKCELFHGKMSKIRKSGSYKGKNYFAFHSNHIKNEQLVMLRKLVYENNKKTLKNVISYIDERSLAFLYMDDGTFNGKNLTICTDNFDLDDILLLQEHLKNKFNIESTITKTNRLHILKSSHDTFFELVSQYIHPSMRYKLPSKYQTIEFYNYDSNLLDFTARSPTVKYLNNIDSDLYDIGVQTDHCFVANNYLVHNCIAWEKIKRAVDKGIADKDPNILKEFVGDFVFNPVDHQKDQPLDELIEIAEGGTGFMMIQRSAFEKFADKYPQYLYTPDHARQKHFDGSKKIMQYFHTEIDPKDNRYLSEDYWFNRKCAEIGIKTWMAPWLKLTHVGTFPFEGSIPAMAWLGTSLTVDKKLVKPK